MPRTLAQNPEQDILASVWLIEAVAEGEDVVMELLAVVQAVEAPSRRPGEEVTVAEEAAIEAAAVVTVVAGTVAEEIAAPSVEVAIGAEVAVTAVAAAADAQLRRYTRLPREESPSPMPR